MSFAPIGRRNHLLADRIHQGIRVQFHQRVHIVFALRKTSRLPFQLMVHYQPGRNSFSYRDPNCLCHACSASSRARVFLFELAHAIQPVESRNFITFCESWVVEHRIYEIIQCSTQCHHSLSDVQQLAGALADDVHSKDRVRHPMEDQLQPSRRIAANLSTRNLPVVRHANLVRNVLFRFGLLLGLPDKADLRNRVDSIRVQIPGLDRILSSPNARAAATRPCSIDTEASDGNPITSPTAKIVGTLVLKSLSTGIRPRESDSIPTAARFSSSTFPCRPTAYSSASP